VTDNTTIPANHKRCSKCGQIFPATTDHFYSQPHGKYGVRARCIKCTLEENREWAKAHPDKIKEIQNRHSQTEKRKISRRSAQAKYRNTEAGHKTNERYETSEKRAQQIEQYRRDGKARKAKRRYMAKPRGKAKAAANRDKRRVRIKKAKGDYEASDVLLQMEAQKDKKGKLRCWWCNKIIKSKWHLDHRVPLAKGGSNSPDNLVISCPACNLSKGAKMPGEWNGRLL